MTYLVLGKKSVYWELDVVIVFDPLVDVDKKLQHFLPDTLCAGIEFEEA